MNNSKLVTKNLTTSGLITSKLATKPSPGNDDGTIDKDNSKSKDSVTPFLTFQPSVTNHYMCQVCTDESSHCNAHTSTSIGAELGRTRDFEQDDEDDDFTMAIIENRLFNTVHPILNRNGMGQMRRRTMSSYGRVFM